MSSDGGKVVCVTGASGYIASWLVKSLLERGYTVKASVRDPNDSRKTEHLTALDGAEERLHLFRADLMEEGSFDSVIGGCDGVFHTASPVLSFRVPSSDPKAEFVDPALKGTLNVLKSCAKFPSIKRVIITSSIAAVVYNRSNYSSAGLFLSDETSFSDPSFCEESQLWYPLSKTLAEKAAWKFAKEHQLDVITINPAIVIGPLLQPTINSTTEIVLDLIHGSKTYPDVTYGWADVRDVANAHIQALELPSANGRYCLGGKTASMSEIVDILHKLYPSLQLPVKDCDLKPSLPGFNGSNEKAKTLGVEFTPLEVSLKDTIESFKQKNFFSVQC